MAETDADAVSTVSESTFDWLLPKELLRRLGVLGFLNLLLACCAGNGLPIILSMGDSAEEQTPSGLTAVETFVNFSCGVDKTLGLDSGGSATYFTFPNSCLMAWGKLWRELNINFAYFSSDSGQNGAN